jgi:hypothetical protein
MDVEIVIGNLEFGDQRRKQIKTKTLTADKRRIRADESWGKIFADKSLNTRA